MRVLRVNVCNTWLRKYYALPNRFRFDDVQVSSFLITSRTHRNNMSDTEMCEADTMQTEEEEGVYLTEEELSLVLVNPSLS